MQRRNSESIGFSRYTDTKETHKKEKNMRKMGCVIMQLQRLQSERAKFAEIVWSQGNKVTTVNTAIIFL